MEITQVGVRTRARAMAMMEEETVDNSGAVKRRKFGNEKLRSLSSTFMKTKTLDCEICVNSVVEEPASSCDASASLGSSGVPASCCSNTGSMEKLKVSDLEEKVETGSAARYNSDERESTPTSKFKVQSGELDSTTAKQSSVMNNSCRTVLPSEKMPPEAELEEFFAAAQEGVNERFKKKYNYDIVNDIPLKGRFEWIHVNPEK